MQSVGRGKGLFCAPAGGIHIPTYLYCPYACGVRLRAAACMRRGGAASKQASGGMRMRVVLGADSSFPIRPHTHKKVPRTSAPGRRDLRESACMAKPPSSICSTSGSVYNGYNTVVKPTAYRLHLQMHDRNHNRLIKHNFDIFS